MASNAKDIQLRELKDTVSQLKTMISEQTELIKSLRLIIDEKSSHEKALQEQVDYLTKKLFGSSSEKRSDDIPGQQNLFDEAEVEQDPSLLEVETVIKEHTRKKKAGLKRNLLPVNRDIPFHAHKVSPPVSSSVPCWPDCCVPEVSGVTSGRYTAVYHPV